MTNSLFKKGLVSAVAASAIGGVLFAATTATLSNTTAGLPAVKSVFSAGGDSNFTSGTITIAETTIAGASTSSSPTLTITVPASLKLASSSGADINYSNITSSAYMFVAGIDDSGVGLWIDVNGSETTKKIYAGTDNNASLGIYKIMDLNMSTGGAVVLARDTNATNFMLLSTSGAIIDINKSAGISQDNVATRTVNGELNATKVSTVTKATDGSLSFTLNLQALSNSALDSVQLPALKFIPASATTSGDASIAFAGSGGISDASVKIATLQTNAASIVANTAFNSVTNVVSNDKATAGTFADFNITIPDSLTNTASGSYKGKIAVKLANAKFKTVTVTDNAGLTYTVMSDNNMTVVEGNVTTSDTNSTLIIDKIPAGATSIKVAGTLVATTTTSGSDVTVNFSTATDTNLSSDRNFSSLKTYGATATALKIATVAADGVTVGAFDSNTTRYTAYPVVPARTEQAIMDVNLTELFVGSFEDGKTVTLTLPSGYTFSSAPRPMNGADLLDCNLSSAIGSSVATITFNKTAQGTITSKAAITVADQVRVQNLKVAVPSSAKEGDEVSLTIGGTLFTATKLPSASTIKVATVKTSTAAVTEINTTTSDVSAGTILADGYEQLDINESFAGQLVAGNTITVKLTNGAFDTTGTQATVTYAGTPNLALSAPVFSDSNTTATYTVTTSTTTASTPSGGARIPLPAIKVSATAGQTVSGTIAGTTGVAGTFTVAKTVNGHTVASTLQQVAKGDIDTYAGYITITEGLKDGISTTTVAKAGGGYLIKLLAPAGVSFASDGAVKYLIKSTTTTGTVTDFATTDSVTTGTVSTTFNSNDTLTMSIGSFTTASSGTISDSTVDVIKFRPKVNISSSATDGSVSLKLIDNNVSAVMTTKSYPVLYVGTIPTLTAAAAATIPAGGTGSVVPTNAQGTVTYTGAANGINVSTAGVVTVDANATAGATATITATDGATGTAVTTVITVGAAAPVAYTGSLALASGWNLVTSPIDANISAAALNTAAVASATSGNKLVWVFNASAGTYASTGAGAYTGSIVAGQGAWVKSASAQSVSVSGTQNATAFNFATAVTALPTGWSVLGNSGATTTAAISGVKAAWGFDAAINNWKNYSATAVTGYTSVVGVPAGTALWIEK
jgi:hypothetical protein